MFQRQARGQATIERPALASLTVALLTGLSTPSFAQELQPPPPKQPGAYFVPMLTAAEVADSNVFFTQFPESDFVTRFTGGLQTGYRSRPFSADFIGARSADYFQRHPEFNTTNARSFAQLTLTASPVRPLTFSLLACYLDTRTPSELNLTSGLAVGRSLATRVAVTPMLEYRAGTLSTITLAFPTAHDELDGRVADTKTAMIGFDRQVTRRDTLSLRFEHRRFDFTGGPRSEKSTADVVMFGWMGQISDRSLVVFRGGPRFAKGAITGEFLATMKRRTQRGLVTLTYTKSQVTSIGRTGALDIQSLVGTFATRISKKLDLASGPGVYRNTLRGNHLMALRLNVEALWNFAPWFHLGATWGYDLQQPDFAAKGHIGRNTLQIRVVTSPRQRRTEDADLDEPRTEGQ